MKKRRLSVLPLIFMALVLTITVPVFHVSAVLPPWQGYVKPAYPDYATSGMPDFDQNQSYFSTHGGHTWCGPVSVADSLWWLDSEYESMVFANPVPPPAISDHFPLVQNYTPAWDDHNSSNVRFLVTNLALLMDTDGIRTGDGHIGTRLQDMINGTEYYLMQQGVSILNSSSGFEVVPQDFPSSTWVSNEILNCEDVELFLEFWRNTTQGWVPFTQNDDLMWGHYVACAGVNTTIIAAQNGVQVLISDPYQDAYEAGKAPGRSPVSHPYPHSSSVHNDAQYVSQDAYNMTLLMAPPPIGYPATVWKLDGYLQTVGYGSDCFAFVRAAVSTSPVPQWQGYTKPPYPDYAPSGMPDFYENQQQFQTKFGNTWCVPVAVANSLWWLDSEYESIMFANPVPPPTISDHFNLVNSSNIGGVYDDHSPSNVIPLVTTLANLMHTDGLGVGNGYAGTNFTDIQSGIQQYLKRQGVDSLFEVHNSSFPTFAWIDNETQFCQDVEIILEFWEWNPNINNWQKPTLFTEPQLLYGHCVTCAGSNSTMSQLLISDPGQDQYEAKNVPGRSPIPHNYPHNFAVHNDAQYVSQDAYDVSLINFTTMFGGVAPPGYGTSASDLDRYLQLMPAGYPPTYYAFIRGAVSTSPTGIHDISVTNVTSQKTIIDRGYSGNITVTTSNLGNFTETFNTTLYANQTIIGTCVDTTLTVGNSINLTFTWNTTGFAYGNYTIWAYAGPVAGQTSTDNNCTDGLVLVTIPGDVTPVTLRVTMDDIMLIVNAFGSKTGQPRYNANADITNDGRITMDDIMIAVGNFGHHYP